MAQGTGFLRWCGVWILWISKVIASLRVGGLGWPPDFRVGEGVGGFLLCGGVRRAGLRGGWSGAAGVGVELVGLVEAGLEVELAQRVVVCFVVGLGCAEGDDFADAAVGEVGQALFQLDVAQGVPAGWSVTHSRIAVSPTGRVTRASPMRVPSRSRRWIRQPGGLVDSVRSATA